MPVLTYTQEISVSPLWNGIFPHINHILKIPYHSNAQLSHFERTCTITTAAHFC